MQTRLPVDILQRAPASPRGPWGSPARFPFMTLLLIPTLIPLLVAGCGGGASWPQLAPGDQGYAALHDSLGINAFLELDEDLRSARRKLADQWQERSQNAPRAEDGVAALMTAAGLAPDDPEHWLALAGIWRWVGDYLNTEQSLENAATAVRKFGVYHDDLSGRGQNYRSDAALRTALLRAWLHYDRGEYSEGLQWARAARKIESGNGLVKQIQGLLLALLGYRSAALQITHDMDRGLEFTTDIGWIHSNMEKARGRYRESFEHVLGLRPMENHNAECWRDMGRAAERVGEWSYAQKWYRESVAALPFRNTSGLLQVTYARLGGGSRFSHQPFWMASDHHYVTGSLSAYAAYALQQFDLATDPAQRERWGAMVINAAGICMRLDDDKVWAQRARGMVFAATGLEDRAMSDLNHAARDLADLGIQDSRVEAAIGHLWLVRKDSDRALTHLQKALRLDDGVAAVWSDLGLSLIMAGDHEGADEALSQAIARDRNLTAAWYNRGLMYFHADNMDRAEADLSEAARLAPDNMEIGQLLQEVQKRKRNTPGE